MRWPTAKLDPNIFIVLADDEKKWNKGQRVGRMRRARAGNETLINADGARPNIMSAAMQKGRPEWPENMQICLCLVNSLPCVCPKLNDATKWTGCGSPKKNYCTRVQDIQRESFVVLKSSASTLLIKSIFMYTDICHYMVRNVFQIGKYALEWHSNRNCVRE